MHTPVRHVWRPEASLRGVSLVDFVIVEMGSLFGRGLQISARLTASEP